MIDIQNDKIRGHCARCGEGRLADVMGSHTDIETDDEGRFIKATAHRILKCRGCESIYHQMVIEFAENELLEIDPETGEEWWHLPETHFHWPSPLKRKRPDWLTALGKADHQTFELLDSVYKALDADLNVLAAIGLRTVFDRATESFEIDAALTFNEKLSKLHKNGYVGETEKDILSVLTDAGSAAAHRGWKPSAEQLATMMSIVEGFLQRTMILRREADSLKIAVPQKKRRQKEA